MKTKPKDTGSGMFLYEENPRDRPFGLVNGHRAVATANLPQHAILFGDFASVILADWGTMDILVDPYSERKKGNVAIRLLSDWDVGLRTPVSFAKNA